jgi:hypothetical protein
MAAGLGFKTFAVGEVLSAANVNGYLMQGVLVFANATARDAAITSPQEGQFAYLKDTNITTYYTGSAWANLDTTGMTNPMTTTGDTIYSSSGSTPARLGIGTAGQILTVNAGATAPEWKTPAAGGGGKVLQVVYATYSTSTTVASTSYTDTGLQATIVPTSATSTILVFVNQQGLSQRLSTQNGFGLKLLRGASVVYNPDNGVNYGQSFLAVGLTSGSMNNMNLATMASFAYQDSPATTSSTVYKVQGATQATGSSGATTFQESGSSSSIVLMEIGA